MISEHIPYNDQLKIIKAVLKETNFENKYHTLENTESKELFDSLNLKYNVYVSISPEIEVIRANVPLKYSHVKLDLRDFNLEDDACSHEFIDLYWEEGGSAMICGPSGTGYNYAMCCKCGQPKIPKVIKGKSSNCIDINYIRLGFTLAFFLGYIISAYVNTH